MKRTYFLESHGWDKDADRNTGEGQQLGPLALPVDAKLPLCPRRELAGR